MNKRLSGQIILATTLMLFCICFTSAFYWKQLYRDGSSWAFRILSDGGYVVDSPYLRYSSVILQIPSLVVKFLIGDVKVTIWFYCFGHFILPFLALMALYYLLRRNEKFDLIFPIILNFFIVIVPTWAFSNSVVTETIVFFWVLYAYVLSVQKPNIIILSILGLLIFFGYESGLVFFPLTLYILWREKKLELRSCLLFTILFFGAAYNLLFRLIPANAHVYFKSSYIHSLECPFLWLIPVLFLAGAAALDDKKWVKNGALMLGLVCTGWLLKQTFLQPLSFFWAQSYLNRTMAIPLSFGFFFVTYEVLRVKNFSLNAREQLFIAMLLIPSLVYEFRLGADSRNQMNKLSTMMKTKTGCRILSDSERIELTGRTLLQSWDLPYVTTLLNKSYKITTVYFNPGRDDQAFEGCRMDKEFIRPSPVEKFQVNKHGDFDFSEITTGLLAFEPKN